MLPVSADCDKDEDDAGVSTSCCETGVPVDNPSLVSLASPALSSLPCDFPSSLSSPSTAASDWLVAALLLVRPLLALPPVFVSISTTVSGLLPLAFPHMSQLMCWRELFSHVHQLHCHAAAVEEREMRWLRWDRLMSGCVEDRDEEEQAVVAAALKGGVSDLLRRFVVPSLAPAAGWDDILSPGCDSSTETTRVILLRFGLSSLKTAVLSSVEAATAPCTMSPTWPDVTSWLSESTERLVRLIRRLFPILLASPCCFWLALIGCCAALVAVALAGERSERLLFFGDSADTSCISAADSSTCSGVSSLLSWLIASLTSTCESSARCSSSSSSLFGTLSSCGMAALLSGLEDGTAVEAAEAAEAAEACERKAEGER